MAITDPNPTAEISGDCVEEHSKSPFSTILHWIAEDFHWSLLSAPVLVTGLVYFVSIKDIGGLGPEHVFKAWMEFLHPALLLAFLLVSWSRWFLTREAAFAFLGVLSLCVFSRELIGQGSSFIVYGGIIVLFAYAVRRHERLVPLLKSDWVMSFVFMCFVCYAASQLLDRGAVKHAGRIIMSDSEWKLAHSSNLEEALESLGGGFLLLASSCVRKGAV